MEQAPRHPVLFGEYELTIDEKNRLPIPAAIRKAINPNADGEVFFLVLGINRKPWLYPKRYYEELVMRDPSEMIPGDDLLEFDQMHFAMASPLEWDQQGRVLIPERIVRRTELEREVTLIGVRNHLELWNRAQWNERRDQLLSRGQEIARNAKKAREMPQR